MMAKLALQPYPTFKLLVSVPVAGKTENDDVVLTVKYLTKSQIEAHQQAVANAQSEAESNERYDRFIRDLIVDWDLDADFTPENLNILLHSQHPINPAN